MSKRDGRIHLMELLGRVGEKYVLEAEYSEQELANLKASGASTPVVVEASETSGHEAPEGWPTIGADQCETDPEEDVNSTSNVEKIPVFGVVLGVALVAAAILLVVFLWHPDRTDVVSTTESSVEETTTVDGSVKIDEAHFPDTYFREYIQLKLDTDNNGILDENEVAGATEVDLDTYESRTEIRSLSGIEYLTQLERLVCSSRVTELDVSRNEALKSLSCRHGSLHALDVSANSRLMELDCSGTDLGTLDISKNNALITLRCSDCGLTELSVRNNPILKTLVCNDNALVALDVSGNLALTELNFTNNNISEIDLSRNKVLTSLSCKGNALDTVDARNNPQLAFVSCDAGVLVGHTDEEVEHVRVSERNFPDGSLWETLRTYDRDNNGELDESEIAEVKVLDLRNCYEVNFTSLRFLTSVEELYWQGGEFSTEVLSFFPKLKVLDCSFNYITSLDLSTLKELEELRCVNCSLSKLEVSQNPKLQVLFCEDNPLVTLNVSANEALVYLLCDTDVEVIGMRDVKQNDETDGITVDVAHFPDRMFRKYIMETVDVDRNGKLADNEIKRVTELIMKEEDDWYIYSLKGIEYFTNLRSLVCESGPLASLDVSKNVSLMHLECGKCDLKSLDVSHNPLLEELNCCFNYLTELDTSRNPALKELYCHFNNLTTLDLSHNPVLETLVVDSNRFAVLDVSHNPILRTLSVASDSLPELDVSHNPMLEVLSVGSEKLAGLDVSQNPVLKELYVSAEELSSLDVSHNVLLEQLYCGYCALTELDVSHNPQLMEFSCSANALTSLDVSQNPLLVYLSCYDNQLETLDLSNNPDLTTLGVDDTVHVIGAREDCYISPAN